MDANVYLELESSMWNSISPFKCRCNGRGWLLSPFDTWHRCREHGVGAPHPEDDEVGGGPSFLSLCRKAFAKFREMSVGFGLSKKNFNLEVRKRMCGKKVTVETWLECAEMVMEETREAFELEMAQDSGYSSCLEYRLAMEAEAECFERFGGGF